MRSIAIVIISMLLFNAIFGCLEFGLWKLTSRWTKRFESLQYACGLLMLSVITLLVPANFIGYMSWIAGKNLVFGEKTFPYEFLVPDKMQNVVVILLAIWFIGVCYIIWRRAAMFRILRQKTRTGVPAAGRCRQIFEEECQRLHITDKVEIRFNPYVNSPHVFYYRHCHYIQIPPGELPEEEFRIICRHELGHVKHHDHRLELILRLMVLLNWYNRMAWFIAQEAEMWIEICRDEEVIDVGDVGVNRYYDFMARCVERQIGGRRYIGILMFARKNHLTERKEIVMEHFSGNRKVITGFRATLVFAFFVISSVSTAYAGIEVAQRGYLRLYEAITEQVDETVEYEPDIEYTEATTELPYAYMELDPRTRTTSLSWTVLKDNRLETVAVHMEAGQKLLISGFASPETVSFKYGYTDHNTDHYCLAAGASFSHTFEIAETGDYYIFFRNLSTKSNLNVDFIFDVR